MDRSAFQRAKVLRILKHSKADAFLNKEILHEDRYVKARAMQNKADL